MGASVAGTIPFQGAQWQKFMNKWVEGLLTDRPRYPLATLLGRAGTAKPSRSSRHFHDCARALEGAVDRLHEIAEVVLKYDPHEAETLMTNALEITLDETFHLSGADLLFPKHR